MADIAQIVKENVHMDFGGAAEGLKAGQDWAAKKADIQVKRTHLEDQQKNTELAKFRAQAEGGKWIMDKVEKALDIPDGKARKDYIEHLGIQGQKLGLADPEMLKSMLADPAQLAEIRTAIANYHNLSSEDQLAIQQKAAETLSGPEAITAFKTFNDQAFQMAKIKAEGGEHRKTDVAKAELDAPGKNLTQNRETFTMLEKSQPFQNYTKVREGVKNLEAYLKDPTPVTDVASLYSMVRAMDPSTGVKEGELTLANAANSFSGKIGLMVNSFLKGDKLTPQQRGWILDLGQRNLKTSHSTYDQFRGGYAEGAQKNGLDPKDFDPANAFLEQDRAYLANVEQNKAQNRKLAKGEKPKDPTAGVEKSDPTKEILARYPSKVIQSLMLGKQRGYSRQQMEAKIGKPIPDDLAKALSLSLSLAPEGKN